MTEQNRHALQASKGAREAEQKGRGLDCFNQPDIREKRNFHFIFIPLSFLF